MRTFKIKIVSKTGSITYTTVQVQSPAGPPQARALAESMYGGNGNTIYVLA
jgi:hypothetical protein